ncbi:Uncharacterised protein [Klebsiella pneumoniae]|nr:Uncharacterised protein [Klebsiella pneumoniae]
MKLRMKTLLVLFSFVCCICSFNVYANDFWVFYKVSSTDLFFRHDSNTIQNLNELYDEVKINADDNTLTINNDLLESSTVCSVEYRKKKETPLSYFYSKKTLAMYENVFKNDNISLAKDIYILRAYDPEKNRSPPYDEIIESDDYLLLVVKDYLIFFKNIKNNPEQLNEMSDKYDFSTFCENLQEGSTFDGKEKYVCSFTNDNLSDAYLKFKKISGYNDVLKETLPGKSISYYMGDAKVIYQWVGSAEVKITVIQNMDEGVYSFKKSKSGTRMAVIIKSGY